MARRRYDLAHFRHLFFALLILAFARFILAIATSAAVLVALISGWLLVWSLWNLRLAKRLTQEGAAEQLKHGAWMRRWFLRILVIEIILLQVVSFGLWKWHLFPYIVPVDILIVSVHFIVLARIFALPAYGLLGGIISLVAIATILWVPIDAYWGNLLELAAIPSASFILANWIVIAWMLFSAKRYLVKT
jgi:hypothetical protein